MEPAHCDKIRWRFRSVLQGRKVINAGNTMRLRTRTIVLSYVVAVPILAVVLANRAVLLDSEYTVDQVSQLPSEKACLILGASRTLAGGEDNLFYRYRMQAAREVYAAGKCSRLVVSGDNRHAGYNEPEDMKRSLVALGVPAGAIYCDYAGGRTLDSVLRFRAVFGQQSGIVISQGFHNARAIYIARANGIRLTGYNAREVDAYNGFRTSIREIFSRVRAVADVAVFHSGPRHYGQRVIL